MILSEDQPIFCAEDDQLGRTRFSRSMAQAVRGRRGRASFVMALHGAWGSGKTSIKNLMIEELRAHSETCPIIVEFEPWLWTDVVSLTSAFFSEIEAELVKESKSTSSNEESRQAAQKSAKTWRNYSHFFKAVSFSLKGVGALFLSQGDANTAASVASVANQLDDVSNATKLSADTLEEQEDKSSVESRSLADIRRELAKSFSGLERPILVIIDDIDRLTANETTALFSLVKANANFPNLVYLLLFQRDIVEHSLSQVSPGSGREFLEKIVQVGFDVPEPETENLEILLKNSLNTVWRDIETDFDIYRFQKIWALGFPQLFHNARDVRRYVNALSFQIDVLRADGNNFLEVDIVDLLVLEAIRVFEPQLYSCLYANKMLLTWERRSRLPNKDKEDAVENLIKSFTETISPKRKSVVEILLQELFPQIEWAFGDRNYYSSVQWNDALRQSRACHPAIFDRFFQLAINARDISNAQVQKLLKATKNRSELVEELSDLHKRGLLDVALGRLVAHVNEIPRDAAVEFLTGLCDVGDIFPLVSISKELPIGWGQEITVRSLIKFYFQRSYEVWAQTEDNESWQRTERASIFQEAFAETTGFFLPVYLTYYETRRLREESEEEKCFLLEENDGIALRSLCLNLIRRAAEQNKLLAQPRATFVLSCWRDWAGDEEVQDWVKQITSTTTGLFALIRMTTGQSFSQSLGERVTVTRREENVDLQALHSFVPLDEIERRINEVDESKLSDEDRKIIGSFRFAMQQGQRGDMRFQLPKDFSN